MNRLAKSLYVRIEDLHIPIQDLESANKRLREDEPSEGIAGLQEELISVKMREAESSLALKEMRQRMAELEQQWAVRDFERIVKARFRRKYGTLFTISAFSVTRK